MASSISKLSQGHPWSRQFGVFMRDPLKNMSGSFCNPYDKKIDCGPSKIQTYTKLKHDHICRRCKKLFRAGEWAFHSQRLGVTCSDCVKKRSPQEKELGTPMHQFKTLHRIYSCEKCCAPLEPGMKAWHAPDSVICVGCKRPPKNYGQKKN